MFSKMSSVGNSNVVCAVIYTTHEISVGLVPDVETNQSKELLKQHYFLNVEPPLHESLCGKYMCSFAFQCLRVNLPNIIRELMYALGKNERQLINQYGHYVHYDIRRVSWSLDLLLADILQNAPFKPFFGKEPDTKSWNAFLLNQCQDNCRWYTAVWHQAESYMYRRISAIFKRTDTLSNYDYFEMNKKLATRVISFVMVANVRATRYFQRNLHCFKLLLKLSLWSHRCDLSIGQVKPLRRMRLRIAALNKDVIVDESEAVWHLLVNAEAPAIVDIVCNNTGYELFTDLLLAEYLIETGLARKVRFHVKAIPWFIMNATRRDFRWMLRFFIARNLPILTEFGLKLYGFIKDGSLELCENNYFWTSGYSFQKMRDIVPCLYVKLSEATLIIFKGDNNYRKLLADIKRNPTEPFSKCVMPFLPTSVCVLRPIFSDLHCGMPICAFEWLTDDNPHWMKGGKKATIQLAVKPRS